LISKEKEKEIIGDPRNDEWSSTDVFVVSVSYKILPVQPVTPVV
jgi:hypothetical protein